MDASLYRRPNKPRTMQVTQRREAPAMALPVMPEIITVDTYSECHVTPLDVARRMVDYLGETGDFLTLESSAGTGNIIQALYESGHSSNELVAIERHPKLCAEIRERFKGDQAIHPINECFIEYAERVNGMGEYPRIIMNPPFKKVKTHLRSALNLLGPGGHDRAVLVALVPISFHHDEAETLEELPRDTFSTVQVSTKIIRIER